MKILFSSFKLTSIFIFTTITFFSSSFISTKEALAQGAGNYVPLAPIEGFVEGDKFPDIVSYINNMITVIIAITVILAVIMIIYGGVQYMTTDSISGKGEGRARIQAAIGGLILALASWLILRTIDINITQVGLNIRNVGIPKEDYGDGYDQSAGLGGSGIPALGNRSYSGSNFDLQRDQYGNLYITPGRVAIDTDGIEKPPFHDPHWQGQTSWRNGSLNANTDNYVVVPIGSNIPLGTKVLVTNHNTGKTITAYVGDRGPSGNGYGELSLNAARELGAWHAPMGNSALQHDITYTFLTGSN